MSKEAGRAILEAIVDLVPEIEPEFYGNWEPLKRRFDRNRLEEALESWEFDFKWKHSAPRFRGHVRMATNSTSVRFGKINLYGSASAIEPLRLLRLVEHLAAQHSAEYAFVHQLRHPDDASFALASRAAVKQRSAHYFMVGERVLSWYLPDLYWATILGPSYVELFGRELLLTAPSPHVEALPYGGVTLRLGDSLTDLKEHFVQFRETRRVVKDHLNHDAFFDPRLNRDHQYAVPEAFRRPNDDHKESTLAVM